MKKILRQLHRWLGLLMALQIIAWMGSGLYFAWFPIETIRGEHLTLEPGPLSTRELATMAPGARLVNALTEELGMGFQVDSIEVERREEKTYWIVRGAEQEGTSFARRINATSARVLPMLDEPEARHVAIQSLRGDGEIASVAFLTEPGGHEYRGRPLPAWRVSFVEPEGLNLYLDAWTGQITARRTDRWRVFDFLWMLHIMDFDTRDDFNTPLLQLAAFLGLLIALSGVIYWAMTTRIGRRREA